MDATLLIAIVACALVALLGADRVRISRETKGLRTAERNGATAFAAERARADEFKRQVEGLDADLQAEKARVGVAEAARASVEAHLEHAASTLEAQKQAREDWSRTLESQFKFLAADALKSNRADFLDVAEQRFKASAQLTAADVDARKTAIESLVKPIQEALEGLKRETDELEQKRQRDMGKVEQQYRELAGSTVDLQVETAKLVNALHSPHVRGRWGQITLRRVAELTGMVAHCDFFEQETAPEQGVRLRPDLLVRMPAERLVVIDAKVPLAGYLDAVGATTTESREEALGRHAQQVRDHVAQLASKDYQAQFDRSPDFVVAFIPNDSVLAAAAEKDPELVEFALSKGVAIATPATLFALLRAIEFGWRQDAIAQNARHISVLGQQVSERIATLIEHFARVGDGLRRAVDSYNDAVGSLESRVLPTVRRFRELGAGGTKTIGELQPIDFVPRAVAAPIPNSTEQLFPDDDSLDSPGDWVAESAGHVPTFTCTCRICGAVFEGTGPRAQFCSSKCRTRGHIIADAVPGTSDELLGDALGDGAGGERTPPGGSRA